jgi:hypothetical protein
MSMSREGGSLVLLDHNTAPTNSRSTQPGQDVAELRLVGLVRVGDGYMIRAAGRLAAEGGTRAHMDITFGDAVGACATEMETAVRHIERWCEEGAIVALRDCGSRLTLLARDGTTVPLPLSA